MKFIYLALLFSVVLGQEIITDYVVADGDTLDNFAYQIPEGYTGNSPSPLLVAHHQWNGSAMSCFGTEFDEEANVRGWFFCLHSNKKQSVGMILQQVHV